MEPFERRAFALFEETFQPANDFTLVYSDKLLREWGLDGSGDWWLRFCRHAAATVEHESCSFELRTTVFDEDARLQVSRAYAGTAWTVSVRWEPKGTTIGKLRPTPSVVPLPTKWSAANGYQFSDPAGPFLFSISEVVNCLWDLLRPPDSSAHRPLDPGLLLITGSTNSSKSLVARGLVAKHIEARGQSNSGRRPHLVTFEDPIEKGAFDPRLWQPPVNVPDREKLPHPIPPFDYTPRQKPIDSRSLEETLQGALRQTPAAFYIGELREHSDVKAAMNFAGTGHLAIATAHAGSLVEAAEKVLKAVEARDSGNRALYVPKILGIIHLRLLDHSIELNGRPVVLKGLVPCLYRRTTLGIQGLIADGLFSLIPFYSEDDGYLRQTGCFGRQYLARRLGLSVPQVEEFSEEQLRKLNAEKRILLNNWELFRRWNCLRGEPAYPYMNGKASMRLLDKALWEDVHGR